MLRSSAFLFLAGIAVMASAADSADPPGHPDASDGAIIDSRPAPGGDGAPRDSTGEREDRQQRVMSAGLLMLVLILVSGLALVIAAMYLGGRARKVARKPLPAARPLDELWYLRRPKELPPNGTSAQERSPSARPDDSSGSAETRDA